MAGVTAHSTESFAVHGDQKVEKEETGRLKEENFRRVDLIQRT
jgi:hypothetical protein